MNLRKNDGITLSVLIVTVFVLSILSTILLRVDNNIPDTKKITSFRSDIEKLNVYVEDYYQRNNSLPVLKNEEENILYTSTEMLSSNIKNPNDNENYFVIDIDALKDETNTPINLEYGMAGFNTIKTGGSSLDVYIINEETHKIYYPKGVETKGNTYYTEIEEYAQVELPDIIKSVTMKSSEDTIEYAVPGDTIYVIVDLKRELDYGSGVTGTIADRTANVEKNGKTYTLSYTIPENESELTDGELSFSVLGVTDDAITNVTQGKKVTLAISSDTTPPTATIAMTKDTLFGIKATVNVSDGDGSGVSVENCKYVFTTSNTPLGTENENLYTDGTLSSTSQTIEQGGKRAGSYYMHLLAKDVEGNPAEIISQDAITVESVINYDYNSNKTPYEISVAPGTYKLEVWGAEGGYRSSATYAGKGGYSTGVLNLPSKTNLKVYVGGSGRTGTVSGSIYTGGYNGGGYRYGNYGGGGATDIRINSTSLHARVIVAGGGGSDGSSSKKGMYGGGTSGGSSTESYTANSNYCGKGGTQTYSGYSADYTIASQATSGLNSNSTSDYCGGFGFGGGGVYLSSGYGGAGGGGWYGGSGTVPDGSADDDRGGGGGSGYVYTSSTASNYPSGCLLTTQDNRYYLTNASTTAGNTSFTAPGGGSETGHSGNGYARITNNN